MGTPSQVSEAAELAEKLHQEMFSQDSEEDIKPEDVEEKVEEEPEVDEEEEEVIPHDDDLEELRKFKSRYLSLKGKYDAEVPRLQHELKDLKTSVFEKLSTIAEKPAETKVEQNKQDDIVAKMKEEYGEDFIDGIYKIAEHIADLKVKTSSDAVQEKLTSVEDTQLKVAQENFKSYLDTKVTGDWRALWEGKDPKFIEHLQKPDPSGLYTYGDLVQMYNDQWDGDKLAIVINNYLDTKKGKKEVTKPNPERDALVAPSRSTHVTTPNVEDKEIWTKASIKEFERQDRQSKFAPEESQRLWNDLLTAASEGRIR